MKLQIFAVLFLIAGSYALPSYNEGVIVVDQNELAQKSVVVDQIKWVIELISNIIKGVGLDPIQVEEQRLDIEIPFLLKFNAFIENFRFAGTSDIKIHNLEYDHIINRLDLDVSLPEIVFEVGNSGLYIQVLSIYELLDAEFKGRVSINSIRLAAEVNVDVSIISGISLRSLSIDLSLGGIESDLTFIVNNIDGSGILNNILNERIPNYLDENRERINGYLEFVVSLILRIVWA
ncbi:uncharacterized protein LOC133320049 [Danaus plexippus]|uniref:uncharacterized protein LOC133320049 n=1 Tax=Danaus plexippus TaxID=13037 RepID=UPI002AB00B2B|nr:uncharacterized protein LOC133320049 [Danaus plexippus]